MKDDITSRVIIMATEVISDAMGETLFRHEEWPHALRTGEWIDIDGNDEEITSIRYRRGEDGTKFVLVDVEIRAGSFKRLGADNGWCLTPEEALANDPF